MKKTQHRLMALFCAILAIAAILYVCGEFMQVDMTLFGKASRQQQFICKTVMIMLTIGLLPLSLRLFKMRKVQADLQQRQAPALLRWGTLRLLLMGALLVGNALLYYAFAFESTYGYLAVVTLLTMPFVIPTKSRCNTEVAPDEEKEEKSEEEPEKSEEEPEKREEE